jgi:hypothetical protein
MIDSIHRLRRALPLLGMSLLMLAALRPSQGKTASLAGTWKLDVEKTAEEQKGEPADPRSKQGYNSGGRPRVGTGMTEPRGGSGGTGGAPGASAAGRVNLGPLTAYARPQQELVIVQTDSTISITDPRGTPRSYRLNGKKEVEPLLGVDSLEVVARWKGGKLTTERKFGQLGSIREVYSLDSGTLIVEVRVTAPQLPQPLDTRRIYAKVAGS